jgi:MFS family permease
MNKWRIAYITFVILSLVGILSAPLWLDNAWWWMDTDRMLDHRPVRPDFEDRPLTAAVGFLINLAALFWGGVFILYLLTGRIRRMADELRAGFQPVWRMAGLGLAITLLGLLTIAATAMTPITAPLALLLLLFLALASIIGTSGLGFAIGRLITDRCGWQIESPLLIFGLGTLTLTLLYRLPYIGIVFMIMISLTGLGLITTTRFGSGQPWTLEPLLEE